MKKITALIFLGFFTLFFNLSLTFTPSQDAVFLSVSIEQSSAYATQPGGGTSNTTISNMFETTKTSGDDVMVKLCAALNGYMGWMIILFGGVLGAWEYFVQRQGHLLVAIVIGCVAIIFLGKIMKTVYKDCK